MRSQLAPKMTPAAPGERPAAADALPRTAPLPAPTPAPGAPPAGAGLSSAAPRGDSGASGSRTGGCAPRAAAAPRIALGRRAPSPAIARCAHARSRTRRPAYAAGSGVRGRQLRRPRNIPRSGASRAPLVLMFCQISTRTRGPAGHGPRRRRRRRLPRRDPRSSRRASPRRWCCRAMDVSFPRSFHRWGQDRP